MSMTGNYRRVTSRELAALHADPHSVPEFLYPDDESEPAPECHLDIDKAWHAIHFLLNGDPWQGHHPLANVVLGGTELAGTEIGYGPVRYLVPDEVRAVADALAELPAFELLERFDPQRLNEANIYPDGWSGGSEELEYIRDNYLALTEFFRQASVAKDGMLLYLS